MASGFESALQRALAVRLNLQMGLSSMPTVEEWMDIHLDRFIEHVPMPPEMPDGFTVSYLASFGSDLRRLLWGAWGDPRGFVPKMADYFKLCNMAKSDEAIIDQIGNALQPQLERKLKLEQYTPNYQERKRLFDADLRSRHGQFVPPIINTRPADLFDLYLEVMSR